MLYRFEAYKSQQTWMGETSPPRTHALTPVAEPGADQVRRTPARSTGRCSSLGGSPGGPPVARGGGDGCSGARARRRSPGADRAGLPVAGSGARRAALRGRGGRTGAAGGRRAAAPPPLAGGEGPGQGPGLGLSPAPLRRGFGRAASAAGSGREASGCRGTAGQRPSAAEVRLLPGSPPSPPARTAGTGDPFVVRDPGRRDAEPCAPAGLRARGSPTGPDGTRRASRGDDGVGAGAVEGRCKGGGGSAPGPLRGGGGGAGDGARQPRRLPGVLSPGQNCGFGTIYGLCGFR